jgi:hypothetical protein
MSRTEGAIYIYTWNDGRIDGLTVEKNLIDWNPPAPAAPIVNDNGAQLEGAPIILRDNVVRSTSPLLLRSFGDRLVLADNKYQYVGLDPPSWFWNGKTWSSLEQLQAAGAEKGSTLTTKPGPSNDTASESGLAPLPLKKLTGLDGRPLPVQPPADYRLVTSVDLRLDADGLLSPDAMARLAVLRTLVREYSARQLQVLVFVSNTVTTPALSNALLDLDTPSIQFVQASAGDAAIPTTLLDTKGQAVAQWPASFTPFNAATIGYAVRLQLGIPIYAQMDPRP